MPLLKQLFLPALVCAFVISATGCDEKKSESAQLPPPLVSTITLERMDVPLEATFMGQTLGYLSVEVRAQIPGILKSRMYKEGDYVTKGQLLFDIDPAQAQAALEQARGQLSVAKSQTDNAKRELDRILPLYTRNAVSQRDRDNAQAAYDSARAQLESAQARVNEAQIQLGYTKVIAPISGFTSREAKNEGNLITLDPQGSLLTTINQTDPMYVTFAIPSADMGLLKRMEIQNQAVAYAQGMDARMIMLEGTTYPLHGEVTFLDTKVDQHTSVVQARAQFPNPKDQLLPGQYASVTISGTKLLQALMIPQNAVLQTAKGPMVYAVGEGNKVGLKPLTLGKTFGQDFLVEGGLEPGEVIVVEGINKIVPDMVVSPTPLAQPEKPAPLPTPESVEPNLIPGGAAAQATPPATPDAAPSAPGTATPPAN